MARPSTPLAANARLTLRAHPPAPARVELVYQRLSRRILRTVLWLSVCWGAMPFLLWVPPHYPWVAAAFVAGSYLAYRSWTGRYAVQSFAGICPRCGSPISMGADRRIDLPFTITCFSCHFEPQLEIPMSEAAEIRPEHHRPDCVGLWEIRWLADEPFVYCEECHGGAPATPAVRATATAENDTASLLARLTAEGRPLI